MEEEEEREEKRDREEEKDRGDKEEIGRRRRKREGGCPGTSWDLISGEGDFWVNGHPGKLVNVLGIGRPYTAR